SVVERVGEARVRDQPVSRLDLLHQREPETLRDAAFDLAFHGAGIDRLADLLRGADPDDARETELDVHLRRDFHRADAERDVRPLAGDLAVDGIERARRRVPVDALHVHLTTSARLALRERGAAGISN